MRDYLVFNKASRNDLIRNNLCMLKSIVDGSQDFFDLTFEQKHVDEGIRYDVFIRLRPINDGNYSNRFDVFNKISDYINHMLEFMFSESMVEYNIEKYSIIPEMDIHINSFC